MEKDALLERVLDLEWEMYERVECAHPASCQSAPGRFRLVRGSTFSIWTAEMLAAYLVHIEGAKAQGRNLLTEKYAHMDNLLPPLTEDPMVDDIVDISVYWQFELQKVYPALCKRCCRDVNEFAAGSDFSAHFRSELGIYGERALELYHRNVLSAYEQNRNLAAEALLDLVQKSGYRDLEHANVCLSRGSGAKREHSSVEGSMRQVLQG